MSQNVVKCMSCNVVICELLAYVQNKINVMDEESIVKLCKSAYTVDEIVVAKNLLFESLPAVKRNIVRKNEKKG